MGIKYFKGVHANISENYGPGGPKFSKYYEGSNISIQVSEEFLCRPQYRLSHAKNPIVAKSKESGACSPGKISF